MVAAFLSCLVRRYEVLKVATAGEKRTGVILAGRELLMNRGLYLSSRIFHRAENSATSLYSPNITRRESAQQLQVLYV